jgi:hypothetical protein
VGVPLGQLGRLTMFGKGTARPEVVPSLLAKRKRAARYHSFQVSSAQYPRPVCSRNVMLGPGFQVSS